ncbi:MAG: hypothetical protein ACOY71_00075 [Gemmatimonadota bacterium]
MNLSRRSVAWRLFLTCWFVYVLHFATDFAREHYLVVTMVDQHTFRLDPYLGWHADIFRNPPEAKEPGVHHGANPGISLLAAIPYAVTRPAIELINREVVKRQGPVDTTGGYNDPRPNRVKFFKLARAAGVDIKFGLVGAVTMALCMAPLTAASAVAMFALLGRLGLSQRLSLALALTYAFGTPVFFRTAYLNQNLGIAVFAFLAFLLLWDPGHRSRLGLRPRYLLAGASGGFCFLADYSGALALGLLGLYGWLRRRDDAGWGQGLKDSSWYALGAAPMILALWFYQWQAFGHPFLPPQHWMPPEQAYSNLGAYKGVGVPQLDLLLRLLVDPSYGLFIAGPIFLLALGAPWLFRRGTSVVPVRETVFCFVFTAAFVIFFSAISYTRLQWVTGIRYLAPVFPFLFLPVAAVLVRLPRWIACGAVILSVTVVWCQAMVRGQKTVLSDVTRVFLEGFQLPWLTVLGKTASAYAPWLERPSPLPLFTLWAVLIAAIWLVRQPGAPLAGEAGVPGGPGTKLEE